VNENGAGLGELLVHSSDTADGEFVENGNASFRVNQYAQAPNNIKIKVEEGRNVGPRFWRRQTEGKEFWKSQRLSLAV
jgi:hypothetical protein